MENLIIHKGSLFQKAGNNLFSYFNEIIIPELKPQLSWNKGQFSWDMWDDIKNICAFTNKEHKSECMVRLYFNEEQNDWKAVLMPQQMSGMTISDKFDVDVLAEEDCVNGWIEAGSVHHHCNVGASQSGTDEKDESQQIGIFITLGKINSDQYDIHSRFKTIHGFKDVNLMTFFETPEWMEAVPEQYRNKMLFNVMCDRALSPGDPDKARKDWIDRIEEKKTWSPSKSKNKWNGYGGYEGYGHNDWDRQTELHELSKSVEKLAYENKSTVEDQEEFYNDVVLDLSIPIDDSTDPTIELDDILMLIDTTKQKANEKGLEDTWDLLRETMIDGRKTIKKVNLTGLRKYIVNNRIELEVAVQTAILEEQDAIKSDEEEDANEMGKTNHAIGII